MKLACIEIVIELLGPILTQASIMADPGIDAPFARNHSDKLYIPYSLVKGKLKEAARDLNHANLKNPEIFKQDINSWFGKSEQSSWDPDRGRLHFTDFVHQASPEKKRKIAAGIKLDHDRKACIEGALRVIEKPFEAGAAVDFVGTCWFFAKDNTEIDQVMKDLAILFRWLTSLGSDRTGGFGRFIGARLNPDSSTILDVENAPSPLNPPSNLMDIVIEFRDPFCIAQKRITKNLFESSEIIPGGALKGTLATMICELFGKKNIKVDENLPEPWSVLGRYFHSIRFTHAFPSWINQERPKFIPLSIVKGGDSFYEDAAFWDSEKLLTNNGENVAPEFRIDWKDDSKIKEAFCWPVLPRELRVRHEHDAESLRAKDENLFAYESVVPSDLKENSSRGIAWRSRIDLSEIPLTEKSQVWGCLSELFKLGFLGIGKTKARTRPIILPETKIDPAIKESCGVNIVVLQTPALICDPKRLSEGEPIENLYNEYWDDLSSKTQNASSVTPSLKLIRFFARQSLAGGYLGRRFQGDRPYNSFLLTDAGSVFVLETIDPKNATFCLEKWRNHGLPLPGWVIKLYGESWETNPFIRENGYGEIVVNGKYPAKN
jgi:hypothetical protein